MSRRRGRPVRGECSDAGAITALMVLFALALLIAVVGITDLSAAYLRRQAAMSLADGAALAATEAAAAGSVYDSPAGRFVDIDQPAAAAAVQRYLAGTGAFRDYPGLRAQVRVLGHRVVVALVMPYRLPIPLPGAVQVTDVHASSAAELPIYQ